MVKINEKTIELTANLPTDFVIKYWYDKSQEMPESEKEHVIEMIEQGYVEGELNDSDENRGWWRVVSSQKSQ
jgi:hypothetical protein